MKAIDEKYDRWVKEVEYRVGMHRIGIDAVKNDVQRLEKELIEDTELLTEIKRRREAL